MFQSRSNVSNNQSRRKKQQSRQNDNVSQNDGDIVVCNAHRLGKCRYKKCQFSPCCFERNNKPMTQREYAEQQKMRSQPRQSDGPRQSAGPRQSDAPREMTFASEEYVPVPIQAVYGHISTYDDASNAIATRNAEMISHQLAILSQTPKQSSIKTSITPPAVTTIAGNIKTFSFTREQYDCFIGWFDINSPSINHLLESHVPFWNFVQENYDEYIATYKEFSDVIAGIQKPQSRWLKEAFEKQLIDVDDIINNKQTYQSITKLIAYGVYLVFKTFITNQRPNNDTLIGLVVASYVCNIYSQCGQEAPVPSFDFISSNMFVGMY